MTETRTAVLLMSYGTPRTPADILPYYTDIRRGRPPTDEQLAELTGRYEAIGGISPLAQRTDAQRVALQAALDDVAGGQYHVTLGMKHAAPFIEDAVTDLAGRGFRRLVGLVLAPHYSAFSIGQYLDRMTAAAAPHGIEALGIRSWATEPAFVEFIATEVRGTARHVMAAADPGSVHRPLAATADPHHRRPVPGGVGGHSTTGCRGCGRSRTGASPGRAPDAHQSRGWGPTSCRSSTNLPPMARRGGARQRGRIRGRSPRSALRPRHRGQSACGAARPGLRPHPAASTTMPP